MEQLQMTLPFESENGVETEGDGIPDLSYVADYITGAEAEELLVHVDNGVWLADLKRRVQHYGFKYDYRKRKVDMSMHVGRLPDWLERLSQKLYSDGHMPKIADQVIVNEYLPGQGISAHIDCEPCFEDTIVSMSLESSCVMHFTNKRDQTLKIPVLLEPRSIVVLTGQARYEWMHSINARRNDEWKGNRFERGRRVSLTFRKVIVQS
jgi:alkylated DNA repair dioxygenase AlkB